MILKEHDALITCMEFSYEGDCFVSGEMDSYINMWWLVNCAEGTVDAIKVTIWKDSVEKVLFSPIASWANPKNHFQVGQIILCYTYIYHSQN